MSRRTARRPALFSCVLRAALCGAVFCGAVFCGAVFCGAASAQDTPNETFRIVVHDDNPLDQIDQESIARIFMKKKSSWEPWDQPTVPIDRPLESPLREAFSRAVHGKSVNALNSYWQRMIFSGRSVPPDVLGSDLAVFEYILAHPGAIAYVEPGAELPEGVKQLEIVDE